MEKSSAGEAKAPTGHSGKLETIRLEVKENKLITSGKLTPEIRTAY